MSSSVSTSTKLHPHNTSQTSPDTFPFLFSIAPDTDLWLKPAPLRSPPTTLPLISTSQPTFYASVPLSAFIRATATISFLPEVLYDQAGLVLLFPRDSSKWIKGGLEYVDEQAKRSVVVTAGKGSGADWSVAPAVVGTSDDTGRIGGEVLREVTWVFAASDGDPQEDIWVGFYGARPAKSDVAGELKVSVEKWDIVLGNTV
ncbi:hypothetical protein DXG01_004364 [Tephrocybe rancida]|nr:hypothetical protein DXG01_004364 [Tephrocybe rancida]